MLSEPPRCRPVPVRALKGADSPRGLHRGHSPGHMSPPGARSTGGGWLLPASWPDPNRLRQVNPDHDETYRGEGRGQILGTFKPKNRMGSHLENFSHSLIPYTKSKAGVSDGKRRLSSRFWAAQGGELGALDHPEEPQ